MANSGTGKRQNRLPQFPDGAWGCLVSSRNEVGRAKKLGASWVVASHAGLLPGGGPASVMALMPYADANGRVLEMGPGLIEEAGTLPVFAGILAMDQFRVCGHFLGVLAEAGFAGIQTFPSVGIVGGKYRHLLEDASLGRQVELDALTAATTVGLHACGVAFAPGETAEAVQAGADMVLAHLPLARSGGVEEWSAATCSFFTAAQQEAGTKVLVAAFVPHTGKPLEPTVLGDKTCLQFENIACATLNRA